MISKFEAAFDILNEFTKILLLSEAYHRLIGDLLETNIPGRRPIRDRHAASETHRRPANLIADPSETNMPDKFIIHLGLRRVSTACRSQPLL